MSLRWTKIGYLFACFLVISSLLLVPQGWGSSNSIPARPAAAQDAVRIAAAGYHTCALTPWRSVMCWGWNPTGQLGDGSNTNRLLPVMAHTSPAVGAIAIDNGYSHTCGIFPVSGQPDTEGSVKCWGWNAYGQLGNGGYLSFNFPVDVSGLTGGGVTAISLGESHSCAQTNTGVVKCWGYNNYGQLGRVIVGGNTSPTPQDVSGLGTPIATIAAGGYHTCALTTTGGVKCWGMNNYGQLGVGTTPITSTLPLEVYPSGSGVIAITAGRYHSCALLSGNVMTCWGINDNGQLGDGTRSRRYTPVNVTGLPAQVESISAGNGHTCAVTAAGALYCWGFNQYGQIGVGDFNDRLAPAAVSGLGSGVLAANGGERHTCALLADPANPYSWSARCWGQNLYGQLGDGTTITRTLPVDTLGFPGIPVFLSYMTW